MAAAAGGRRAKALRGAAARRRPRPAVRTGLEGDREAGEEGLPRRGRRREAFTAPVPIPVPSIAPFCSAGTGRQWQTTGDSRSARRRGSVQRLRDREVRAAPGECRYRSGAPVPGDACTGVMPDRGMPVPETPRTGRCRYRMGCLTEDPCRRDVRPGDACNGGCAGTCGVPVPMLTHTCPAARCWGGGGERQRRRRWRRRRRRRNCAWPSSTWRSSASSVSPARYRCPAGRPRALSPSLTHCPAAEEERAEDEEELEPADLIGDRLKEDVVSGEAGAASRSPWQQRALSPSHGTGTEATSSAERAPSSPAGAERPAAAPGRQRCECQGAKLPVPA